MTASTIMATLANILYPDEAIVFIDKENQSINLDYGSLTLTDAEDVYMRSLGFINLIEVGPNYYIKEGIR